MSTTALYETYSFSSSEIDKANEFVDAYKTILGNRKISQFVLDLKEKQLRKLQGIYAVVFTVMLIILITVSVVVNFKKTFLFFALMCLLLSAVFYFVKTIQTAKGCNPMEFKYTLIRITLDVLYGVPAFIFFISSSPSGYSTILSGSIACLLYALKMIFQCQLPFYHLFCYFSITTCLFITALLEGDTIVSGVILLCIILSILSMIMDIQWNLKLTKFELTRITDGVYACNNHLKGQYYYYNTILYCYPTYSGSICVAKDKVMLQSINTIQFSNYEPQALPSKLYIVQNDEILAALTSKFVIWVITDPESIKLLSIFHKKKILILSGLQLQDCISENKPQSVDIQYSEDIDSVLPYLDHLSTLSTNSQYLLQALKEQFKP